jgi:ribosome maturation factor RimP
MGGHTIRDDLELMLGSVVSTAGLDLEGVELASAGRRRVIRVYVDRDGGVDLDTVADISQAVSGVLDRSDLLGNTPYVLEVSSPGVERPLTLPRHWRRSIGRLVRVSLVGGDARTGRVLAADESAITLDEADTVRRIAFAEIAAGRVQVEFSRPEAGLADADEEG